MNSPITQKYFLVTFRYGEMLTATIWISSDCKQSPCLLWISRHPSEAC